MNNPGKLLIVTAPSGSGKTTIVRHLLQTFPDLRFSISATNRPRRSTEFNGRDYYFLSTERFRELINSGAFLEWEEVYQGQYYGSLRSEVDRIRSEGLAVIFDIDVQGAVNLKKTYGEKALALFIRPPSLEILIQRLRNRQTEDEASLEKRIARVTQELTFESSFDLTIVNDKLSVALQESENITRDFLQLDTSITPALKS
ncbi:MAG: guanylate kinase [Saprospiraceae bacterium]|jgi:guanylate kinase|nr:guanylate kinase [Saprospiraceae bacterium]